MGFVLPVLTYLRVMVLTAGEGFPQALPHAARRHSGPARALLRRGPGAEGHPASV